MSLASQITGECYPFLADDGAFKMNKALKQNNKMVINYSAALEKKSVADAVPQETINIVEKIL